MQKHQLTLSERLQKIFEIETKRNFDNLSIKPSFSTTIANFFSKITLPTPNEELKRKIDEIIQALNNYENNPVSIREKTAKKAQDLISTIQDIYNHNLSSPIQYLKGVGPNRAKILQKIGIRTIQDLILYFPRDWDNRKNIKKISQCRYGEKETICGEVLVVALEKTKRNFSLVKIAVSDTSDIIYAIYFNQPYMKDRFKKGDKVILTGKVERGYYGQKEIQNPEFEIISDDEEDNNLNTGRIVPLYTLTEGISQRVMRQLVKTSLDFIQLQNDFLPQSLRKKLNLISLSHALYNIHFPEEMTDLENAKYRLIFDEFFLLQLLYATRRQNIKKEEGIKYNTESSLLNKFYKMLPFELTSSQKKVIDEIKKDMEDKKPMNRLIQGDVGSGKTIVAIASLLIAVENGYQGAFMAPTEILAEQHYLTMASYLYSLGVSVGLLISGISEKEKQKTLKKIKTGEIQIIIGTHALIQERVEFKKLGIVIIDEQHRFGVLQRLALREKGTNPEVLVMTATPIPRTLALTLYGDLDISIIDELPKGRQPISTSVVPLNKKPQVWKFVREQVKQGRQAYIVCPLIEESEKLEVQAATKLYEKLQQDVFPDMKLALLHGKLSTKEKDNIMKDFYNKKIDILISTTVIEVGIDVPNATVMVIENAERFGLAQLHQLRGRIGRGKHQSYCILLSSPKTEEAQRRLQIICETTDGFKISEEDMKLRGPGELYGVRQHGLLNLSLADIFRDAEILEVAKKEAENIIKEDANLSHPENYLLKKKLLEKFKDNINLVSVS